MKKEIVVPSYSKKAFIVSLITALIYILIKVLEKANIYLHIFGCGTQIIMPIIFLAFAVSLISGVVLFIYKNTKYKKLVSFITAVFSTIIVLIFIFAVALSTEDKFFEFSSDDGKHQIVVKEQAVLLAGFGRVYEKTSFFTMSEIGSYTTDDGYRPFSDNYFDFAWYDDHFVLHYNYNGNDSDTKYDKSESIYYIK